MQVSGRSGRSSDNGRVVIQTMQPNSYIFPYVINHDFDSFYEKEIGYRRNFSYPPFSRMSLIEISGKDAAKVNSLASKIFLHLKNTMSRSGKETVGVEIMKPAPALIYKIKNRFRYHIIIKSLKSQNESIAQTENLLKALEYYLEHNKIKSTEQVSIDVDPLSFY